MSKDLKILVVEDEQIVAEDIRHSLLNMGYSVSGIAGSGREALRQIKKSVPDLVLMDIILRGRMNGIETAEKIRAHYDIPLIYLTAYADLDTLNRAKLTEPLGYILKPLDNRELQSAIEMAVYRHRMEMSIKERESWFSTTLRSIGDGVIASDTKGHVTFMNPVAQKLTGWDQNDAIGKSLSRVFHILDRESRKKIKDPIVYILDEQKNLTVDDHSILIAQDKQEIPIESTFSPIKNDRGDIIGAVVVFRDIVDRLSAEQTSKLTEEALRESEERYRSLFEESRDSIYITTRKGNFVIANQSTMELFGFSREEMFKLNLRELYVNPEDWRQFKRDIEEKGSVRDYEVKLKNKSGEELDCLLTSSVRLTQTGKILGYQGIIRDITERKRAEEEKEKIQAQLLQAQKMEAVGILAGGIAHDFNNILTVIQGNSDLCMLKINESNELYVEMKEIQVAAMRAADLTSQLLLFSQKKPMRFESIQMNQIVESLLKMLHRLIGEDIWISTDLEPNLWTVRADRGTMEQIIMNLAINARDAMPNGGRLKIKSENIVLDKQAAQKMTEARPGRFICLTISDTGMGMDNETIQHIFEPFFSTKGTRKGTGLGLSVVYGIVVQHSGWIHVTSKPGKGSAFQIYIPGIDAKIQKSRKESVSLKEFYGDGSRILVVEDEKGVKEYTTSALREHGYEVISAESAREAEAIFEREEGHFDMVLSDVVLADITGLELVDNLLSKNRGLKILLCSGYTGEKSQWIDIQKRGFRFMQKPYTLVDLLRVVKEVLNGK